MKIQPTEKAISILIRSIFHPGCSAIPVITTKFKELHLCMSIAHSVICSNDKEVDLKNSKLVPLPVYWPLCLILEALQALAGGTQVSQSTRPGITMPYSHSLVETQENGTSQNGEGRVQGPSATGLHSVLPGSHISSFEPKRSAEKVSETTDLWFFKVGGACDMCYKTILCCLKQLCSLQVGKHG
jgi:hypothetical protein